MCGLGGMLERVGGVFVILMLTLISILTVILTSTFLSEENMS